MTNNKYQNKNLIIMMSSYYNTNKVYRFAVNVLSEAILIGIVIFTCILGVFLMGKCYSQIDPWVAFAWFIPAFPVFALALRMVYCTTRRYYKKFNKK